MIVTWKLHAKCSNHVQVSTYARRNAVNGAIEINDSAD